MEILSQSGPSYRTKLMERAQADRFAAALAANTRFANVAVTESTRAKSEKRWIVTFLPSNPDRVADMIDRQQSKRADRAATEGRDHLFVLDKNRGRAFDYVHNPHSGETYELDFHGRSCPDWTFRCQPAGLQCKHQIALAGALECGEVGLF